MLTSEMSTDMSDLFTKELADTNKGNMGGCLFHLKART